MSIEFRASKWSVTNCEDFLKIVKASGVLVEQKPGFAEPARLSLPLVAKGIAADFKMMKYGNSEQERKKNRKTAQGDKKSG